MFFDGFIGELQKLAAVGRFTGMMTMPSGVKRSVVANSQKVSPPRGKNLLGLPYKMRNTDRKTVGLSLGRARSILNRVGKELK